MDKLQKLLNVRADGTKVGTLNIEEIYELVNQYNPQTFGANTFGSNAFAENTFGSNVFTLNAFFIKSCIIGLQNKIIDPDIFLTAAISGIAMSPNLQTSNFNPKILLIAIALRFGANPNLYIIYSRKGTFHVMIYTVMFLRDNNVQFEIINYILCILTLLGSRSNSLVTPTQNHRKTHNKISDSEESNIIVNEWLYNNGFFDYNTENLISYIRENFNEDEQVNIGAMCDIIEVAFPRHTGMAPLASKIYRINDEGVKVIRDSEEQDIPVILDDILPGPDLSQVIIYNSYKCIPNITPTFRYQNGEVLELRMCLEGLSFEAFKFLFDKGYKMTYFNLNRLLILMKDYGHPSATQSTGQLHGKTSLHGFKSLIYIEMLKYAISKGLRMDLYQFNYFITFASNYTDEINEIYSSPLWMKSCSASSNVPLPEAIKELAVSLNILSSEENGDSTGALNSIGALNSVERMVNHSLKEEVCLKLREISEMGLRDPQMLIDSNLERQRERMNVEINKGLMTLGAGSIGTFGSAGISKGLNGTCANSSSFNENPLNFSDDSLVYLRDSVSNGVSNSNAKVWCFTPNMFSDLISSGKNPYTNTPLPSKTIAKMANILDFMESLKIDPKKIVSVRKAVEKLNSPDMINNEFTDKSIAFVENISSIRGIFQQQLRKVFEGVRNKNEGLKIYEAMVSMGFDLDYLRPKRTLGPSISELKFPEILPVSLLYATFCKALYIFAKKYNDIQRAEMGIPTPEDIITFIID